jgi:hypothetical protein
MDGATRRQCDADRAGIGGCQAPVAWTIKAADMRMHACGRHLNRVCLKMSRKGAEYMTLSAGHG